ncbi:conserved hypothetical protein [Ricinus communis]|uniref:Uncharacterized protein n=1 Tax=Ricinus communis TaxID=3988 RepID=B9RL25_RICCO|nr:conserved hypothetical protein [Ricinus communis]
MAKNFQSKATEKCNERPPNYVERYYSYRLKETLAKQAELGVEVAEIPSRYLSDSEKQVKDTLTNKDSTNGSSFSNTKPTLRQKLLSAEGKGAFLSECLQASSTFTCEQFFSSNKLWNFTKPVF